MTNIKAERAEFFLARSQANEAVHNRIRNEIIFRNRNTLEEDSCIRGNDNHWNIVSHTVSRSRERAGESKFNRH